MQISEQMPSRALISASSMSRRKLCPGSAHAEKGLPRVESEYSEEGTLLHWHDAHPDADKTGLTSQQRGILERNAGLRQAFLERELPRLGIASTANCMIFRERELFLMNDDGITPVMAHGQPVPGHPDLIHWYYDFRIAIIFDSKFGRIPVEPAWLNEQLKTYFVMFCDCYDSVETVIVAITQPWAGKENDFHSGEYSGRDAPVVKQELLDDIRGTEPLNAPRRASVEACAYCLAMLNGECPVAVSVQSDVAELAVAKLTPQELMLEWDSMILAEKVIDAMRNKLKYYAENFPDMVPELELKSTGTLRSVDASGAFECLLRNGVLPLKAKESIEMMLKFCKFSVSTFEDFLFEDEKKKLTRPQAKQAVKDLFGSLLVEKEKQKSLVRKTVNIHNRKAA